MALGRFADVFGLDLIDVKTFFDEVPKVPRSAYKDLKGIDLNEFQSDSICDQEQSSFNWHFGSKVPMPTAKSGNGLVLVPMFSQPGSFPNFFDLLREKKVSLENAYMLDSHSLRGTIRVQNVSFHKQVTIRYTTNEWKSSADLEVQYLQGSCDGFSDKFVFHLVTAPLSVGQRIQFCIRFNAGWDQEIEFWDSNNGKNYTFQCVSSSSDGNSKESKASVHGQTLSSGSRPIATRSSINYNSDSNGSAPACSKQYSHSPSAVSEEPWMRYL